MTRREEIDWTFRKFGTDKGSHGYAMVYDKLPSFIENILEIGVGNGSSLEAWAWLFPNATIYALDIEDKTHFCHPQVKHITSDIAQFSFSTHWNHSAIPKFDLIVDDGSHQPGNVIHGWKAFSDKCKGLYVVEDMDWGAAKEVINEIRGGSSVNSMIQCGPSDGDTCVVASFGRIVQW